MIYGQFGLSKLAHDLMQDHAEFIKKKTKPRLEPIRIEKGPSSEIGEQKEFPVYDQKDLAERDRVARADRLYFETISNLRLLMVLVGD